MLKLKNISPITREIYNESDCYIKIRLLFKQLEPSDGVCYWNAYGQASSLTEITLYNPTGAIYDLTIFFAVSNIKRKDISTIKNEAIEKIGFPLFETYIEKYQEGYYHLPEEKIDFEIHVGEKDTTILFSSNSVVLHVNNESVIFGFDCDNDLCYIHLKNMTLNEEGFLK